MKNLLNEHVKEEILKRVDMLSPSTKAQWGKMNINQALRHMAMAFQIANGELNPTPVQVPKIPKWLLKFFLLQVKPPKEKAETFLEMNMVANNIEPGSFEEEKKLLKDAIIKFGSGKLLPENKLTGKFSRNDWGKLNFNHTDHHLRQFGA